MASLSLKNITKLYPDGVVAVADFCLEVADKEFLVLTGPSGCGKTVILKMIAGLEEITGGKLYIDGAFANSIAPEERGAAIVSQSFALFPHMTVFENIAFGLSLRGVPQSEVKYRVEHTAEILDISGLLKRKPEALSAGQRQCVALGRAVARNPKIFLFDDPFLGLHPKLRAIMRKELVKLHLNLNATFIYATRDAAESASIGDRVAVFTATPKKPLRVK